MIGQLQASRAALHDRTPTIQRDGFTIRFPTPPVAGTPLYVIRQGFDSAGAAVRFPETLTVATVKRLAFPGQLTANPRDGAASDCIYSTDVVIGFRNRSAEVSPVVVCNWGLPDRLTVGNTLSFEIVAGHRDARSAQEVRCAIVTATDGTTTVSTTVTGESVSGRASDKTKVVVYAGSLDISTLTDNHLITLNGKVYPWVGDVASIADSSLSAQRREFSPRYYLKDTTHAATPFFAYLDTTGSSSGVFSTTAATAAATPFATVLQMFNSLNSGAAGKADSVIVRVKAGTFSMVGSASARNQSVAAITFAREPGTARAAAIVQLDSNFRPRMTGGLTAPLTTGAIRFNDITVKRSGNFAFTGESATQLELIHDDVDFDNNGATSAVLSNAHDYFFGGAITNLAAGVFGVGTYEHRCFRGVSATCGATSISFEDFLFIGNSVSGTALQIKGGSARGENGAFVGFNKLMALGASPCLDINAADTVGFAVIQNVFEYISTTSNAMIRISSDSGTINTSHVILHHNTMAGWQGRGRCNIFYDDGPTPRSNKLMSCKGNIHVQPDTKGDWFVGADNNGSPDPVTGPGRVDNWFYLFGVGCAYEFEQYQPANPVDEGQAYFGAGSNFSSSPTVLNDPKFTTYAGTIDASTPGAGFGDYTLQGGSPCKAAMLAPVISFDLAGTTRSTSAASMGAYE